MALKFQYNKIALQSLNKQLDIRLRSSPTLKSKEATLRFEVAKAKQRAQELQDKLELKLGIYSENAAIWSEFVPELIRIGEIETTVTTIAGIKTPLLNEITFQEADFSLFSQPGWFPEGIVIVKELVSIAIERNFYQRKMELLNLARRKTTQKVNLYEKVQIPAFEDAILKIKRFLEDEENLSKSAQKIIKKRRQKRKILA
ncbi:MAG TPA: V-type ATP synthase subunit D [Sunxiuqinia sp.]|nr:V-type ATP synthase subunit D [Sunxiuqinia sp.]